MIRWMINRLKDWWFFREFKKAPIKKLGRMYVKEVKGNLYVVDVKRMSGKRHK